MSISANLRQAAKIQDKIEELRGQLAGLLDKARAELADSLTEEFQPSLRRGRPKMLKRVAKELSGPGRPTKKLSKLDGRTKAARALRTSKRRSPLAGQKRASSPSGPLAPAVVKVLESKNKPMSVSTILAQLLTSGYTFNSSEPRKNLAARIYRLPGVKKVASGLFAKA